MTQQGIAQQKILDLVEKWQRRLDMEDYRVAVVFKEVVDVDDKKAFMRMCRSEYFKRGTLQVSNSALDPSTLPDCIEKDLFDTDTVMFDEFLDESIAHELVHLLLADLMEASDVVRQHIAAPVAHVWDTAWRRAEEKVVEHLSVALSRNWAS